jgi:hypothetical protein
MLFSVLLTSEKCHVEHLSCRTYVISLVFGNKPFGNLAFWIRNNTCGQYCYGLGYIFGDFHKHIWSPWVPFFTLPLGVNLAPRGELCSRGGMFTPSFTPILYCSEEWRVEQWILPPGDNFTPRGLNSSLGDNFTPGGQILPLGAKVIMGLRLPPHVVFLSKESRKFYRPDRLRHLRRPINEPPASSRRTHDSDSVQVLRRCKSHRNLVRKACLVETLRRPGLPDFFDFFTDTGKNIPNYHKMY